MLNVLDLFSGIGGFSLGLERTGKFRTIAFCEIDPFCRKVLKKHWPDVPIFGDIRKLTREQVKATGTVDVVTGGFPCQPFSQAGRRKGRRDPRDLWPEMRRIVEEVRPAWVIGENTPGIGTVALARGDVQVESRTGGRDANGVDYESVLLRQDQMYLGSVCKDLDSLGYEVAVFSVPACAVDAPHRRDRFWILAYSEQQRKRGRGIPGHRENPETDKSGPPDQPGGSGRALYRWPDEREWFAQSGMGRGIYHGIPQRVDRIERLGNAVVPQLVQAIGEAINEA